MNIKSLGVVAAIAAVAFALQPAEAKPKFWAQNNVGANGNAQCAQPGVIGTQNSAYLNGYNHHNGRNNGFNGYGYNNGFNGYNNVGFNNGFNGYNHGNKFGWGNNNKNGFGFGNTSANIDRYQDSLASRIQRGISSGRLTQSEANRLLSMQTRINQMESNFRTSGNRLSFGERTKLTNELNQLSQRLRRELSDRQMM